MLRSPVRKMAKNLRSNLDWWKRNVIYQVYPRSFYDSDGDGVGDLKGIVQKLDYFQWLGIHTLWLSPIYQSPMADFGYDISDYRNIDPLFGTLDDFTQLVKEMHKRKMYLIMDLVPNHTSEKHPWFLSSVKKVEPYTNYYIWKDAKVDPKTGDRLPPNNWDSCFGGSAWTWCQERNQFYLHNFLKEQPDLNYRNQMVKDEMEKIIEYWLNLGVDGFRVDAIKFLMKNESFKDNTEHEKYHIDQPETYEIVQEWVNLVRAYGKKHKKYIFMVTEAYSTPDFVFKYYKFGVDFPFNFSLINWNADTTSGALKKLIQDWMTNMPSDAWPNWVIGNHDQKRVTARMGGREWTDVANMLLLLLPGTPTCYYGDELGMDDVEVTFDQCQDPYGKNLGPEEYATKSRDPCRSPMPWNGKKNAGFTLAEKPWLPIMNDYKQFCVEKQQSDIGSHLHIFKQLLQLRQLPSFSTAGNNFTFISPRDEGDQSPILAFVRSYKNCKAYMVVLNVGQLKSNENTTVDLSNERWIRGKVALKSNNVPDEDYANDAVIDLKRVTLKPAQGLVLALQEEVGRKRRPSQTTEDHPPAKGRKLRKRLQTE